MPVSSHLRRLSNGFQAKISTKRKSEKKESSDIYDPVKLQALSRSQAPPDARLSPWYTDSRSWKKDESFLSGDQIHALEDATAPGPDQLASTTFRSTLDEYRFRQDHEDYDIHGSLSNGEYKLHHTADLYPLANVQSPFSKLPTEILINISLYLDAFSAASFAYTDLDANRRLGPEVYPWLDEKEALGEKIRFLSLMDYDLPNHLLCHQCCKYHLRKAPSSSGMYTKTRPPVACPRQHRSTAVRVTPDRQIRFSLVQAVMRADKLGTAYGIPVSSLKSTWASQGAAWAQFDEWSHKMTCLVDRGHLLLKVVSSCFVKGELTPSQQRLLLSSRDDYSANFSTCPHWTHGLALSRMARCALKHVPASMGSTYVSQCADCRPLRCCTECPTEYLIEVKLKEDKNAESSAARFRHALVITRWSDLGDGSSPLTSPQWHACSSEDPTWDGPQWKDFDTREIQSSRRRFERASKAGSKAAGPRNKALRAPFEIDDFGARVHDVAAIPLRNPRHWASEADNYRRVDWASETRNKNFVKKMMTSFPV